jgi:hypothetical protein
MTKDVLLTDAPPNPVDAERDRKLEVLLDELVTVPSGDELPPDFANRVLARRPFAPWEVSRAAHWRVPAGIGLGLLGGSLALALTPLWSLGPGTAVTVWAELLAVAFGRPVATFVTAFPLLAEGTSRAAQAVSPGGILLVGSLAGAVAVSLGLALGRLRRPVASSIPRRG